MRVCTSLASRDRAVLDDRTPRAPSIHSQIQLVLLTRGINQGINNDDVTQHIHPSIPCPTRCPCKALVPPSLFATDANSVVVGYVVLGGALLVLRIDGRGCHILFDIHP